MANEENLIPFNERTESEQRQIAQKGGIASGAARRRKRSMKEAADYYLSLPETDRRRVNALLRDEVDNEDIDNQMSVVMGITEAAKRGDENAIDTLTTDEALLYSTLNDRIQTEDVYSIVDTLFMTYGMENDIYSIVGNILDIKEEENILTNEKILILKIECSHKERGFAG